MSNLMVKFIWDSVIALFGLALCAILLAIIICIFVGLIKSLTK